MAKIFLESSDSTRTASVNNDSYYGLGGDQVVTVKAKGITADAAVEKLVFDGPMSDYTFVQSGPNALKVMKGADTITTAFVQSDSNGTQLTFANGTVNAVLGATTIILGGVTVGTTAGSITPTTIDTSDTTPDDGTDPVTTGVRLADNNGTDNLGGTAGNDVFTAPINDNSNSLENGDYIDGGAGDRDVLKAEIGNSQNVIIQPDTKSVENFFFQAQAQSDADPGDNFNGNPDGNPLGDAGYDFSYRDANRDGFAQIDAGKMQDVNQLWSDDSRANLVIEDVRALSDETTIGMRDTNPGDVNYEVYFNPAYINASGTTASGAALYLRLLDLDGMLTDNAPYLNNPFNAFSFQLNGETKTVVLSEVAWDGAGRTIDDLISAINAKLDPAFNMEAVKGIVYSADHAEVNATFTSNEIVLQFKNDGEGVLGKGTWLTPDGSLPSDGNIYFKQTDTPPVETNPLTEVDIILDNVAWTDASGSGDLVVGDMSESGIEKFNVFVDRSSHIDQLTSTNNVLEVVEVTNNFSGNHADDINPAATVAANGDLIINELYDVRVFDASTMVGDVKLTAELTANVTDKYLTLSDTDGNPALDNSSDQYSNVRPGLTEFNYEMGKGNDTLDLTISASNLAFSGTTNHEDFVLEVAGNEGNDQITVAIDANATPNTVWYINSTQQANLSINAGTGDDVVRTFGAGNYNIDLGADDDTLYADNSGLQAYNGASDTVNYGHEGYAVWDFNSQNHNFDNEQSMPYRTGISAVNAKVNVSFMGFEASAYIADSNDSLILKSIDQDDINNAIKKAISEDNVLNKLIVAQQGPGGTLIIQSLIDGTMSQLEQPVISFTSDPLNSTQVATGGLDLLSPVEIQLLNQNYRTFAAQTDLDATIVVNPGAPSIFTVAFDATTAAVAAGSFEFAGTTVAYAAADDEIALAAKIAEATYANYTAVDNLDGSVTFTAVANGATPIGTEAQFDVSATSLLDGITGTVTGVVGTLPVTVDVLTSMNGVNSANVADNTITAGTGNDVIVLGTGNFSNDTLVYEDFNNGTDSIVNFQVAQVTAAPDYIVDVDLVSYIQGATAAAAVNTLVADKFVVEFTNATAASTVTYDTNHNDLVDAGDVTVNVTAGMTAVQVRDLFVTAATAGAYTITANADGTATFTETTPAGADIADSAVSDFLVNGAPFTATPTNSGVVTAVVNTVDGATEIVPAVLAARETFTLSFSDADPFTLGNPQYITFDGEQIPVLPSELGTDIAAAVGTGIYTNWDVLAVAGNTVTFGSKTLTGNVTDAVDQTDITSIPDAFTVPSQVVFVAATNNDQIDFSAYDVAAVFVGADNVTGGAVVLGAEYVLMTESTDIDGDGSYTISVYTEAGLTDTLVGTIGIADFGSQQAFTGADFII